MDPEARVFVNDDGRLLVGMVIVNSQIVEFEDELAPGLALEPRAARALAQALIDTAEEIETL